MKPLYLFINCGSRYIEEKGVDKYLIFDSMELYSVKLHSIENNSYLKKIHGCFNGIRDKSKVLLKKYNLVFNGIRDKMKKINHDECNYEKGYMNIKFNSDDNLLLN